MMASFPAAHVGDTRYSQGLTGICWVDKSPIGARFVCFSQRYLLDIDKLLFYVWQWLLVGMLFVLYACAIYIGIRNFKVSIFQFFCNSIHSHKIPSTTFLIP